MRARRLLCVVGIPLFAAGCGDLAIPMMGDLKDVVDESITRERAHADDMARQHKEMHPDAAAAIAESRDVYIKIAEESAARVKALEGRLNLAATDALKTAAGYALKFLGIKNDTGSLAEDVSDAAAEASVAFGVADDNSHKIDATNTEMDRLAAVLDGLNPATVDQLTALGTETKEAIKAAGNDRAAVEKIILAKVDEAAGQEISGLSDTQFWLLIAGIAGTGGLAGFNTKRTADAHTELARREKPPPTA